MPILLYNSGCQRGACLEVRSHFPVFCLLLGANVRTHVMRDLQPYVCTFKDCSLRLFSSRHEWFEHELVTHRKLWQCKECSEEYPSAHDFQETCCSQS